MSSYLISTTGTTVYLRDLGFRDPFTHPTSNFDLIGAGRSLEKIQNSKDLADAITGGTLTAVFNGEPVVSGVDPLDSRKQDRIDNVVIVQKNPGTGEFSSIGAALASITTNSISNTFQIQVGPGIYTESTLAMKPYVYIKGSGNLVTVIQAASTTQTTITGAPSSSIEHLQITGATGVGGKAINCSNFGSVNPFLIKDIAFGSNETQVSVSTTVAITIVQVKNGTSGGAFSFTNGFQVSSTNVAQPAVLVVDGLSFLDVVPPFLTTLFSSTGAGAQLAVSNILARLTGNTGTAFLVEDGSQLRLIGSTIRGFEYGIRNTNTGAGSLIRATGTNFESSNLDISIENTGTTGYLAGFVEYSRLFIDDSSSFFVTNKDTQIVTVAKRGGDFSSIAAAIDSITDATINKQYVVSVGPGVFTEPLINTKEFVSVMGFSILSTIVEPDSPSHSVFNMEKNSEVSFLTIRNAGSGVAGVRYHDKGDFAQLHKVSILDCDNGIWVSSATQDTYLYAEYVDIDGTYLRGIRVTSTGGFASEVHAENFYTYNDVANTGYDCFATGTSSKIHIQSSTLQGNTLNTGLRLENGATAALSGVELSDCNIAVDLPNIGSATHIEVVGSRTKDSVTYNYKIDHPSATGFVSGTSNYNKLDVNPSCSVKFSVIDNNPSSGIGMAFIGDLYQGSDSSNVQNVSDFIRESMSSGVIDGQGQIEQGTNPLDLDYSLGKGFVTSGGIDPKIVEWTAGTLAVPDNSVKYVTVNYSGTVQLEDSLPIISSDRIILGHVVSLDGSLIAINGTRVSCSHPNNISEDMLRQVFGSVYASGSSVTENGVTARSLDVTAGEYYFGNVKINPSGGTGISFSPIYRDGVGGWTLASPATLVSNTQYDNGTGTLASIPTGEYTKHVLIISGEGTNEKYILLYGQATYTTINSVTNADLPSIPPFVSDGIAMIAAIIVQEGTSNIVDIVDIRPLPSFRGAASSGVSDHGSLTGLSDNDHPQYLLRNGTNSMTADINLGGFTLTNVGSALPGTTTAAPVTQNADQSNAEGVSVHKARADHVHNIPTGTPSSIGSSNQQGTANTFAKSDHIHDHGNQAGGTLHSVATTVTDGFMSATDKTKLDAITGTNTGDQTITLTGDVTGSGTGSFTATIANGVVTDAKIATHTTTKISTTSKSLLNTAIVYNDQANTFGDFNQIIRSSRLLLTNPANTFNYTFVGSAITAARQLTLPLTTQTETLAVVPQISQTLPADPITGTTSATGVMMGTAASLTPRVTGRVRFSVTGTLVSNNNNGGGSVQIRYGTGAAPVNGSALTGTTSGNPVTWIQGTANDRLPFSLQGYATGLTVGTAIWIDLSVATNGSGTSTISSLTIIAQEV